MSEHDIAKLVADHKAVQLENQTLKEEVSELRQQLAWLKKQVFGRRTEQASVIMDENQLRLFPDVQPELPRSAETITVPEHKRKKKRTYGEWMESLEIKEVHHSVENKTCENCGCEMEVINHEKAYDELIYQPASFYIRRHIVEVVKCPNCGEHPERDAEHTDDIESCKIRRAEYPKAMIPGSFCSPELLAHIVYEKFAKGMPLHRQERDFTSKGIPILKATMSNWVLEAAERWITPIADEMKKLLLMSPIIHADETKLQVLHEKGRSATAESKMWVYCNGKLNDRSIVLFDYRTTRKGANAKEYLEGFHGYLVCDGYAGYNLLTGVKRCGCMIHLRRYFVNALPDDKSLRSTSIAARAIEYIDRIYHEEKLLADKTTEERYAGRLAKENPLLDELFAYLENAPVAGGKGRLHEAVAYALNSKKYFYTYLENGDVPLDNNRAENAIRPFAVGRKNWLFNNTPRGAKCSAALYSVISTAQANNLDSEKYLTELFQHPPGTIILPFH